MSTALANPLPTPIRGVPKLVTFDVGDLARQVAEKLPPPPRFHATACAVCSPDAGGEGAALFVGQVADAVALEVVDPPVEFEDPDLTAGQKRLLTAERDRLFRWLDARTAAKDAAVLELLADLAGQAPALDATIAEEAARRRETAAARPTLALALGRNRGGAQ